MQSNSSVVTSMRLQSLILNVFASGYLNPKCACRQMTLEYVPKYNKDLNFVLGLPRFDFISFCSEFVFDPCKWPREQMDEDFLKIGRIFNAMRSVVRVPDLDPKYKVAVFASKQVSFSIFSVCV